MATKKTTKPSKNFLARHKVLTVFVALVLLVAGWVVADNLYQGYLDKKDKEKFETVAVAVKELKKRYEAADPSVKWEYYERCSRASVKFKEGDAGCSIYFFHNFIVQDGKQARDIIDRYNAVIDASGDLFSRSRDYSATPPNFPLEEKIGSSGYGVIEKKTGMSGCGPFYKIEEGRLGVLQVRFSCNSSARDTWYPRSDIN